MEGGTQDFETGTEDEPTEEDEPDDGDGAEGAGEEEEAAWQHVASLCAFLPRGEQPLLRMFDGEALLRGATAGGGGGGGELGAPTPAGLLLAACSSE